ncbi:hypothetical protein QF001_000013 [Paraburkholderia youngii]
MDDPPLRGGKFMLMWTSRDAPRSLVGMEMYFSIGKSDAYQIPKLLNSLSR